MNDLEFVKVCHGRHDLRKLNVPDEQLGIVEKYRSDPPAATCLP